MDFDLSLLPRLLPRWLNCSTLPSQAGRRKLKPRHWTKFGMSASELIVLQKSKVAPVQIFGENHKRKEVDDFA